MISFPKFPHVRRLSHERHYRLIEPYEYQFERDGNLYRILVPAGFEMDMASKPRIFWSLSSPLDLDKSAVHHDWLYRTGGEPGPRSYQRRWPAIGAWLGVDEKWTRKEADKLFRKMLKEDPHGPGGFRRSAAYRAIRMFGGGAWQG